jgi:hypothetical protein
MKKILFGNFILFVIILGIYLYYRSVQVRLVMLPNPQTPVQTSQNPRKYCQLNDLQALVEFEGAAGSVYGNLVMKNISSTPCEIIGSNFIEPVFVAENIFVTHQELEGSPLILLKPDQTIYSQVRYPNGPQCSNGIVQSDVSFMYKISPSESISFHTDSGDALQRINSCKDSGEKTEVQVWSIRDTLL